MQLICTEEQRGFTLVELLVVIAIIGILAAAAVPQIMGVICQSRVSAKKSDIGTIQTAIAQCQANAENPDDCLSLGDHYQDYLPERIWNQDQNNTNDGTTETWEIIAEGDADQPTHIYVEDVGCSFDEDDDGNSNAALIYDINDGTFRDISPGNQPS